MAEVKTQGAVDAMEVAEASRETEWEKPSFVGQLFLGNLDVDLIHPFPEQPEADKQPARSSDKKTKRVSSVGARIEEPEVAAAATPEPAPAAPKARPSPARPFPVRSSGRPVRHAHERPSRRLRYAYRSSRRISPVHRTVVHGSQKVGSDKTAGRRRPDAH